MTTLLAEQFLETINVRDALTVNYKTQPQMISSVISGEVTFTVVSNWQSFFEGQQVNVLGLGGKERKIEYPNVLTLKEQGYNIELAEYMTMYVHKDTPKHIVEFYNTLFAKTLQDPEVIKVFYSRNGKPIGGDIKKTRENLDRYFKIRETQYQKYKHRIDK